MRKKTRTKLRNRQTHLDFKCDQLTIDFGSINPPKQTRETGQFQRVKSEMLKRKERSNYHRKPFQYQRLENSLQNKLKQKAFNRDQQRLQLVMLEKCKNFFHMRNNKEDHQSPKYRAATPKAGRDTRLRPKTSGGSLHSATAPLLLQLKGVMDECDRKSEIKQNIGVFTFYCKMMNRRLDGIKNTIEKKERMI